MTETGPLPAHAIAPGWQPLPARARSLFRLTDALLMGLVLGFAAFLLATVLDFGLVLALVVAGVVAGIGLGLATGGYRHRRTQWVLDEEGFAVARGRWWRRETRVPATRVQHLDLKHGPLERRWRLATLVVHTAGSKFGAVSLSGLDADDAEALRDRLARQIDNDAL